MAGVCILAYLVVATAEYAFSNGPFPFWPFIILLIVSTTVITFASSNRALLLKMIYILDSVMAACGMALKLIHG